MRLITPVRLGEPLAAAGVSRVNVGPLNFFLGGGGGGGGDWEIPVLD